MKKSTFTKFLPAVLAMCMATTVASADPASSTAEYNLTLDDYIKITTPTVPTTTKVTYGENYSSATIDGTMSGVFEVISNNREQILYLKGECPTSGGSTPALYGANAGCTELKLVFTKTDVPPASDSVTNITSGSPSIESNPDAIAFKMTISTTHKHTQEGNETGTKPTATWDTNKVKYSMKNGISTFTCNVTGANESGTFNTRDTDGTYQATLILTESAT